MTIEVDAVVAKAMKRRYQATPTLPVAALCREFGYKQRVVVRVLKAQGVQIRKRADLNKPLAQQALKLVKEGRTSGEIASQLGVSRATVSRWRKEAGVSGNAGRRGCPKEIRQRAIYLAVEKGWPTSRVAKEVGYSEVSVRRWVRKSGPGSSKPGPKRSPALFQKAIDLAANNTWPTSKIAENVGVSSATIRRWLREAGVALPQTLPKSRTPRELVQQAIELYDKHKLPLEEVATKIGRPKSTVWTWISAAGVARQRVPKSRHPCSSDSLPPREE
ncbi:helix-turn-helix domain-containing protein [Streptomyces rimosus]|uniref:helix-turn-helix domain-containing protein n=1 Tax=Streptomyces rimosus TaxID=1927 RepID=UPI0037D1A010